MNTRKNKLILYSFFFIFFISRFFNLNWGSPFYFHPDERNIVFSLLQLNITSNMNPHFFAYGSLPIYIAYFTGLMVNITFNSIFAVFSIKFLEGFINYDNIYLVPFSLSLIILRFYSATLSFCIIISLYFIGKKIFNDFVGKTSALLAGTSVGFIQFAHFGTFEMWLTFLSIWFFYFLLKYYKDKKINWLYVGSILLGLLISVKVNSLLLVSFIFLVVFSEKINNKHSILKSIFYTFFTVTKTLPLIIFTVLITSPYFFFDFPSFVSAINYELSVAVGTLPVFYTGQFFNTIPIIFQITKIFPFLINPFLTLTLVLSFNYAIFLTIQKKNIYIFFLLCMFSLQFFPQAFLFTKWTRYLIPSLPFAYMITAFTLQKIPTYKAFIKNVIFFLSIVYMLIYSYVFFFKEDTRITALKWLQINVPSSKKILTEAYDLGTLPLQNYFKDVTLYNFYNLDTSQRSSSQLNSLLKNTDYVILPSQRVIKTRITHSKDFPNGNIFYSQLAEGKLGFSQIYQTPCDFLCNMLYMGNPIFNVEETINIFDRPTIFVFKKTNS